MLVKYLPATYSKRATMPMLLGTINASSLSAASTTDPKPNAQFTPLHQTLQDGPVFVVSGVPV